MKRVVVRTVVLLACWLCVINSRSQSAEVDKARQYGAQGQVIIHVIDSNGNPVKSAKVGAGFYNPHIRDQSIDGQTDNNGCFIATGRPVEDMHYMISKDGYYTTEGAYRFYRPGENCIQDGRWQPWNPTITVVLKEHRNPIPMYAKSIDEPVPIRDAPIGFDCEVGDWVGQYGKGKHPDLIFTYKANVTDYWNGTLELSIACTNKLDGVYRVQKDKGSELSSAYQAPRVDYYPEIKFAFVTTTERDQKVEKLRADEYLIFRVRTEVDDKGNVISVNYGKIYGPIEFGVGKEHHVRFTYYFNPTPNDRNLEFDPSKNLFGNTAKRRVYQP